MVQLATLNRALLCLIFSEFYLSGLRYFAISMAPFITTLMIVLGFYTIHNGDKYLYKCYFVLKTLDSGIYIVRLAYSSATWSSTVAAPNTYDLVYLSCMVVVTTFEACLLAYILRTYKKTQIIPVEAYQLLTNNPVSQPD